MNIEIIEKDKISTYIGTESIEDRLRGYSIHNEILILLRTARFRSRPTELVDTIVNLKKRYGAKKLYIPSMANPYNLAALRLLGIEIFDKIGVELDSLSGFKYTDYGLERTSEDFDKLYEKNIERFMNAVEVVKKTSNFATLRNFAERVADRWTKCLIRYADLYYYDFYEIFYPVKVSKETKVYVDYLESYYRPDIVRFRRRLIERYKKPSCKNFAVFLPCSAKKPYKISKTHRKIENYFRRLKNAGIFHRIILTSPLGIVPWELQYVYPAAHYDIPVVGYWYKDEIDFIIRLAENFIRNYEGAFGYGKSIEFIKEYLNIEFFDNLEELVQNLSQLEQNYEPVKEDRVKIDEFSSVASYQFGDVLWDDSARVMGNSIMVNNKNFLNFNAESGMFTLTELSAYKLASKKIYTVVMEDFELEGDLFAPGVVEASPEIREGDEVVLIDSSGNVKGWGVARMNYLDMMNRDEGLAVSVRHRIRESSIYC